MYKIYFLFFLQPKLHDVTLIAAGKAGRGNLLYSFVRALLKKRKQHQFHNPIVMMSWTGVSYTVLLAGFILFALSAVHRKRKDNRAPHGQEHACFTCFIAELRKACSVWLWSRLCVAELEGRQSQVPTALILPMSLEISIM